MLRQKLKPCPFCGCEAMVHHDYSSESGDWWVIDCLNDDCPMCHTRGAWDGVNVTTGWRTTEAEAIEAWNTRYERTVKLKENDHCPNCKKLVVAGEKYCAWCGAKVVKE